MRRAAVIALCALSALATVLGFVAPVMQQSTFVARASCARPMAQQQQRSSSRGELYMGKVSKFGLFSPAVIAAKVILGEARLNKVRGKAIALHSQTITSFCEWVGTDNKMRGQLIKKAKTTGDELGFLW
jgi:hypothetical protein